MLVYREVDSNNINLWSEGYRTSDELIEENE